MPRGFRKDGTKLGFQKENKYSQKSGFRHSEKTKKKISLKHQGKKRPPFSKEWRENMSKARKKRRGEKSPNWKKGERFNTKGYILTLSSNHPFRNCDGYIFKARLVIESQIGRYLLREEPVHHLGEKTDNRLHMLMAFVSNSAHQRFEKNGIIKQSEIIFDGRKL